MKNFARIFLMLAVLCALASYFFTGLVFSSRVERLSWEELSANPAALEKFKEQIEPTGGSSVDLRAAYEQYSARMASAQSPVAAEMNTTVAGIKSRWARVYAELTPSARRLRSAPLSVRQFFHNQAGRSGIGLTFLLISATVAGLTWLIAALERKARL